VMETRVFLVRHGQTVWNKQGRLQGHRNSSLTNVGKKQAEKVRGSLAQTTIHKAYVSSLQRAQETSQIILHGRYTEVITADNLKEIRLGPWEGKTREETRISHPEQYKYFWNKPDKFKLDGAETYEQLQARVVRELDGIFSNEKGNHVLVVSHWIAIKVAMAYYGSVPFDQLSSVADPGNGSFSVLTQRENGVIIPDTHLKISEYLF